ncbi:signal peptidase II [Synechococcus elongatus]|uniref:signal peptidase II n=1 Tax=Synechococcus elongatus TaxID=32046 RepID=UPI0030CD5EBA
MMRFRYPAFWIPALGGLICDRLSKLWVVTEFQLYQSWPIWPQVFHFTYVRNSGAAFSLFSGGSGWLRWLSFLVCLGLAVWAWFGPRMTRSEQWGYGLIFAGAFGNGLDRFYDGAVIDFLDFRLIGFPVFNIADVLINLGVACLLLSFVRPLWTRRRSGQPPQTL